ncbi:hypothetical protein [Halalkalibacter oceani]|uniref:hypothetical protein n=1 Tax=Halalkalibacter oceani TaxID=1653776 RepID=UPI003397331B
MSDPYFKSKGFNTVSSDTLREMHPLEKLNYVFKVYLSLSKTDDRIGMAISSENADYANKLIDSDLFEAVTEASFTNIFCDKEGVLGVSEVVSKRKK